MIYQFGSNNTRTFRQVGQIVLIVLVIVAAFVTLWLLVKAVGFLATWDDFVSPRTAEEREVLRSGQAQLAVSLIQFMGGILVVIGLITALYVNHRALETSEEAQLADRFQKANEQLGSDKPEVRLGGVYGLARLGNDAAETYHVEVVEILATLARSRAVDVGLYDIPSVTDPDAVAALTMLARRKDKNRVLESDELNLTGCVFRDCSVSGLGEINIHGAHFYSCPLQFNYILESVIISGAIREGLISDCLFTGTWIESSNFSKNFIYATKFDYCDIGISDFSETIAEIGTRSGTSEGSEGVSFRRANIYGSAFDESLLRDVDFRGAQLERTSFYKCNLQGADFTGAKMDLVDFRGASLEGATGLVQDEIDKTYMDRNTSLAGCFAPDGSPIHPSPLTLATRKLPYVAGTVAVIHPPS